MKEVVKIISEWKHSPKGRGEHARNRPIKPGHKRVEAIVRTNYGLETRHIDIKK